MSEIPEHKPVKLPIQFASFVENEYFVAWQKANPNYRIKQIFPMVRQTAYMEEKINDVMKQATEDHEIQMVVTYYDPEGPTI